MRSVPRLTSAGVVHPGARAQLHASQMSTLFKCGEQYRRRYIENEIAAPGIALLIGQAVHAAVKCNLHHKARKGDLLKMDEVRAIAADHVRNASEMQEIDLQPDERIKGFGVAVAEAVDMAVDLAQLHHYELAPHINPKSPQHLERPFVIGLPGYPFDLAGQIDIQEQDNTIRDTKNVKRAPTQDDARASMQLTTYAVALRVIDGVEYPVRVVLDALVKNKTPRAISVSSLRTEADATALVRRIDRAAEIIDKGQFTPADPDWWGCSARFCGYARTCPFWTGRP